MPLPTPRGKKPAALHTRVLRLVLSGLMGALLVVSKQAMSGLPNIEPVTLLVILFALELPRETPGAVTVFILLQGVLYGFGLWWAMYLYVWYLLALLAWLLRRKFAISAVRVKKFCATTEYDATRMQQTGFKPPYTLADGLARTLEFEFIHPRGDKITYETE